ncbi:hypothetical protein C1645_878100 [Glomus cerebriforme]|uniref:BTB domain-containing protein n=1 Tax=Glomus cerebriforme TaxID=658196 RepID=A0A397SMH7_9GLOM|nr:hypothetical protein C1645_878100 [Glomus cerebriforme]
MVDSKLLTKLPQNLLEILNDEEYHDITIEVKNDGILVQIKLPNILPEIFQIVLRYIYSERLSLEEYDTSDIIKLLFAANTLQMDEIQVWENVLKWGLAQNPELPSDISNYLKEDFNILKNTLQQQCKLIPWVLSGISSAFTKMDRTIWNQTPNNTNVGESAHANVNHDGRNHSLLAGIMRGCDFDKRQCENVNIYEHYNVSDSYHNKSELARSIQAEKRADFFLIAFIIAMVDNKFLPKLSQNLLEILNDDEYYDITIENDGTLTNIKLPNILPEIFQIILRYIYGGRLSLDEHDTSDIIKILVTANELSLQELIPYFESFLIENKKNWVEQNFNLIYQTCFQNDSFLELQKYCTYLISKEPNKIFNSPNFSLIPEKLLISLIQHDNLQMSQVQVWEHVLKWGIAQNPELPSDSSSYSNDDFNSLKSTLQKCIPFIKFTKFTSKEFLNKVYPYKNIIPEELCDNLFKYFLDHDCKNEHSIAQNTLGNLYENGGHIEKTLEKAIYWYRKAAENGNYEAQFNLGQYYRYGNGVEKNEKVFEYHKKSADKGYLDAQFELGYCYSKGIGTEANKAKAFELFKIAAENGRAVAQKNLGYLYENGKGTDKDLEKAIYWYRKAAENGNYDSQYALGRCYEYGIGVEKNVVKAFEYYNTVAKKGHYIAQNNLGYLYVRSERTEKDLEKAIYWLQKAAENGYKLAYDNLGICYELGIGVNKDKIRAFELYKKSSEKGYINAKFHLGYCYVNGIGTKINKEKGYELYNEAARVENNEKEIVNDLNEVKHWYQKSAEHDNKVALCKLGEIYELGKGVNQNIIRAFDYYKKAAKEGSMDGKYKLGYYYLHGIIVDTNNEKAFDLYKEAAEGGNNDAQKSLALLQKNREKHI